MLQGSILCVPALVMKLLTVWVRTSECGCTIVLYAVLCLIKLN